MRKLILSLVFGVSIGAGITSAVMERLYVPILQGTYQHGFSNGQIAERETNVDAESEDASDPNYGQGYADGYHAAISQFVECPLGCVEEKK